MIIKASEEFFASADPSWKSVHATVIDTCISRMDGMKGKGPKDDDNENKCPRKVMHLVKCLQSQYFMQCPAAAWNDCKCY